MGELRLGNHRAPGVRCRACRRTWPPTSQPSPWVRQWMPVARSLRMRNRCARCFRSVAVPSPSALPVQWLR
eukprot:1542031-Pleurochrysis_carterae.AAC.1